MFLHKYLVLTADWSRRRVQSVLTADWRRVQNVLTAVWRQCPNTCFVTKTQGLFAVSFIQFFLYTIRTYLVPLYTAVGIIQEMHFNIW